MHKAKARISHTAFIRRELGLPTGCVRSVLDPPMVMGSTISKLVQTSCCLVSPVLSSLDKSTVEDHKNKISCLVSTPGVDYRVLDRKPTSHLLKSCKKAWADEHHQKKDNFVERSTIIHGIKLRAKEIFPDNPTYEQQQRKELDKILESNIRQLFYSIWCIENRF